METVGEIIRKSEANYINGTTQIGQYVSFQMHDTIEKIMAYVNSKFVSAGGDKDSLGREKPFFNIVTAAVNVWYRATDIDRKDISVSPDSISTTASSFFATVHLRDWMKRQRFNVFLNKWGRTLATYGSAVVKFVEKENELSSSVIPWNKLIVDPQDFTAIPVIEKFYLTPAQLRKRKEFNQDQVEALITAKTTRKTLNRQSVDLQNEFIELFEVHGELSQAVYKQRKGLEVKEGDKDIFFQQIHIVSYTGTGKKDKSGKSEYDDFTLYCGKEAQNPYMLTHLIEEDNRTLAMGAVEHLFDAQWMQNHSVKNMKDTLDLASKLIFQTADKQYVNRNVLTQIETGDILVWDKTGSELTQINTGKSDIISLQNFATQWRVLAQEITSTPDALRGNTMPSGTPYSLGAYLGTQANSLFEVMIENKANALEDMLRTFVIPHLKKKLNNKDEIMAILEDHDIKKLDAMYIPNKAIREFNKRTIDSILRGEIPSQFNQPEAEAKIQKSLGKLGNQRSFKPVIEKNGKEVEVNWREALKDLEWKLDINISNEQKDKQATLQSLATTFQTIASLAGRPMSPDERLVFNKIMNTAGVVSPIELSATSMMPGMPMAGSVPGEELVIK